MIPYPHPYNEQEHNDNINHWWAYETTKYLTDRLRNLVIRSNWNKKVINGFKLSSNDLEIHRNRFDNYILELENIGKQLKTIGLQYNKQRINKIKTILIKIKNYEN